MLWALNPRRPNKEAAGMRMSEMLRAECIAAKAVLPDKPSALQEVARLAARSANLQGVRTEAVLEALQEREAVNSTGIGGGVAIPHCRLESVTDFVVGMLTVPDGVPFDAVDGEPVKLIVFIVAPATESNEHVRILSAISQTLSAPGAIDEILAASTPEEARAGFLRHVRQEGDERPSVGRCVMQVFVQDEDLFRDILQVLASVGASSVVIAETENAGAYLKKMPIFAGFWNDSVHRFSRLIVAVVEKRMSNETIRRIEQIAVGLDERDDVLLTVQETSYSAGSLTM